MSSSSLKASIPAVTAGAKVGPDGNHVIWGHVRKIRDNSADTEVTEGSNSCQQFSGQLENVTFKDWSGSADSTAQSDATTMQKLSTGRRAVAELAAQGPFISRRSEARALLIRDGWWSIGSERHTEGTCKPCHYVHGSQGCSMGKECNFCHLPHVQSSNKSRNRPCKSKREQVKKILNLVSSMAEDDNDEEVMRVVQTMACQSSYMQNMFQKYGPMPRQDEQSTPSEGNSPTMEAGSQSTLPPTETCVMETDATSAGEHHRGVSWCNPPKAHRSLVSL